MKVKVVKLQKELMPLFDEKHFTCWLFTTLHLSDKSSPTAVASLREKGSFSRALLKRNRLARHRCNSYIIFSFALAWNLKMIGFAAIWFLILSWKRSHIIMLMYRCETRTLRKEIRTGRIENRSVILKNERIFRRKAFIEIRKIAQNLKLAISAVNPLFSSIHYMSVKKWSLNNRTHISIYIFSGIIMICDARVVC